MSQWMPHGSRVMPGGVDGDAQFFGDELQTGMSLAQVAPQVGAHRMSRTFSARDRPVAPAGLPLASTQWLLENPDATASQRRGAAITAQDARRLSVLSTDGQAEEAAAECALCKALVHTVHTHAL